MQPLVKRSQETYQIARICFSYLLKCDFYWASLCSATPSSQKKSEGGNTEPTPLSCTRSNPTRFPNWVNLLHFTFIKRWPSWITCDVKYVERNTPLQLPLYSLGYKFYVVYVGHLCHARAVTLIYHFWQKRSARGVARVWGGGGWGAEQRWVASVTPPLKNPGYAPKHHPFLINFRTMISVFMRMRKCKSKNRSINASFTTTCNSFNIFSGVLDQIRS